MTNIQKFDLHDDGSEAVVVRGGVKIEFNAKGGVVVHTNGDVAIRPAANDDAPSTSNRLLQPGDRMPDGTIYAGISPDTDRPLYVTPADAPLRMMWQEAMDYAEKLDAHGHQDWRVPTKSELNVLFNNRAAIGGFDDSGSWPSSWYWSSSEESNVVAWFQEFSVGRQSYGKLLALAVRGARG